MNTDREVAREGSEDLHAKLDSFVKRRKDILARMDVLEYVQLMLETHGEFIKPDQALLIMHKTRYEMASVTPAQKQESREWLESRGYSRMYQLPWPPAR